MITVEVYVSLLILRCIGQGNSLDGAFYRVVGVHNQSHTRLTHVMTVICQAVSADKGSAWVRSTHLVQVW